MRDGDIIEVGKKKTNRPKILGLIVWGTIMLGCTAFGIWWMMSLHDPDVFATFQERIASLGIGGWLVLLGIQYVQIVLAFIPGGPIQIVAGVLYGPIGGLAVILVGIVLANATIFALTHRFGNRVLRLFVDEGDVSKYRFLNGKIRLTPGAFPVFYTRHTQRCPDLYLRPHPVDILVVHVFKHNRQTARHSCFRVCGEQHYSRGVSARNDFVCLSCTAWATGILWWEIL